MNNMLNPSATPKKLFSSHQVPLVNPKMVKEKKTTPEIKNPSFELISTSLHKSPPPHIILVTTENFQ